MADNETPRRTGVITDSAVHEEIRAQVMQVMEDANLSEEQKQQILVALNCPCCGGGGIGLSIPLDGSKPIF